MFSDARGKFLFGMFVHASVVDPGFGVNTGNEATFNSSSPFSPQIVVGAGRCWALLATGGALYVISPLW